MRADFAVRLVGFLLVLTSCHNVASIEISSPVEKADDACVVDVQTRVPFELGIDPGTVSDAIHLPSTGDARLMLGTFKSWRDGAKVFVLVRWPLDYEPSTTEVDTGLRFARRASSGKIRECGLSETAPCRICLRGSCGVCPE